MSKKEIKILEVGTPEYGNEMELTYKKYDENETFIQSLKHIRDNLNKMIDNEYDRENIKLQSIINRAIEYIETHQLDFKKGNTTFGSERLSMEERKLIDILRGEDND